MESFIHHIYSIDDNIKFTMEPESEESEGKLPFLDLCIHVLDDASTKITVYRKPTDTDQYLNFKSYHPLQHKRSVVRNLTSRAQAYITIKEDRKAELAHVRPALTANGYPDWTFQVPSPRKPQVTAPSSTGPGAPRKSDPCWAYPM